MGIAPNETGIIGSWIMVKGQMTEDDACRRINSLLAADLQYVATTNDGWEKLYRDKRDGRYWELTYPNGETQGGGPQALLLSDLDKAKEKYNVFL
ncbi:MAG: Imm27 family immunity protein [Terracidiphilus sp.]|jgi:hypothetical protein